MDFMMDARVGERRFRTSVPGLAPGSRVCRLCLRVIVLEPEYIEPTAMHVYLRCPHCGGSFPIRHRDVDELAQAVAAELTAAEASGDTR
jgi:hypothetical protein